MMTTKNEINRIIKSVNASMAFEELEASPEALEVGKRYLNKEINIKEAIELIKKLHLSTERLNHNKLCLCHFPCKTENCPKEKDTTCHVNYCNVMNEYSRLTCTANNYCPICGRKF